MAFTLQAVLGGTTVNLNNGNPFFLLEATGVGAASVRRVTTQGPVQRGDSDKGYRLAPRDVELKIGFRAATDAALDAHRDTLTTLFRPLTLTSVNLRVTRDDGGIRQLDCFTTSLQIPLVKEHRPGHLHVATVHLRAAEPAYYGLAPGTASILGTVNFAANWQLAGGAISASQVLMVGGTPSADAAWSYTGTVVAGSTWTLAMRAVFLTAAGTQSWMFNSNTHPGINDQPRFGRGGTEYYGAPIYVYAGSAFVGTTAMAAGTQNYFLNNDPNGLVINGSRLSSYKTAWIAPGSYPGENVFAYGVNSYILGTAVKWRTQGWSAAVPLYALYSPGLTEPQRNALNAYMLGTAGSVGQALAIAYSGDLPEYPVISITGPITNPSVTNTVTGETLDFGTISIGAGTTYVIDTRYEVKTVKQGSTNKRGELTDDSDLGTWHLAPGPLAPGGTNLIQINGTATGAATNVQIVYYDRYSSW